jgi:hypothetical protein
MQDSRKHPRKTARIPVTVVWNGGAARAAGLILDKSETGVRVRLNEAEVIANDCYILFQRRLEPCRVVWQASRSAGLLFLDG